MDWEGDTEGILDLAQKAAVKKAVGRRKLCLESADNWDCLGWDFAHMG